MLLLEIAFAIASMPKTISAVRFSLEMRFRNLKTVLLGSQNYLVTFYMAFLARYAACPYFVGAGPRDFLFLPLSKLVWTQDEVCVHFLII